MRNFTNKRVILTTPDGVSWDLHVPPTKVVSEITGLGLSPRDIATARNPFQQGSTVLSQRLTEREISITIEYPGRTWESYLDHRDLFIDRLRESRSELQSPDPHILTVKYYTNGSVITRSIKVFLDEGAELEQPRAQWQQWTLSETLQFIAHDPLWYDPTLQNTATMTAATELILFGGTPLPYVFGMFYSYPVETVAYAGDWETFPLITLAGPGKNAAVHAVAIDKWLRLAGEIRSGETVYIDLRDENVLCYNNYNENLVSRLSGDILNFSIQPSPLVSGGNNTFQLYMEESGTGTGVISYYNRYRGILR